MEHRLLPGFAGLREVHQRQKFRPTPPAYGRRKRSAFGRRSNNLVYEDSIIVPDYVSGLSVSEDISARDADGGRMKPELRENVWEMLSEPRRAEAENARRGDIPAPRLRRLQREGALTVFAA